MNVEELTALLYKKMIWHQPGTLDRADARDVLFTLNRLVVVPAGSGLNREVQPVTPLI